MDMNRKLYRSNTNRMICGVCGGIGEYLNVDAGSVDLGPCGLLRSRRCGIFAGGSYYPPGSGKQLLKKTDISLVQKMF